MAIFTGFKPQAMQKIASRLGYKGSMEQFDNFLEQNPEKKRQMVVYEEAAKQMARGGVVKMQEGGDTPAEEQPSNIQDMTLERAQTGALPAGAVTTPQLTLQEQGQTIDPSIGAVAGEANVIPTVAQAGTQQTGQPTVTPAAQVDPRLSQPDIQGAIASNQAATTDVSDKAQILAAQQTASSVANLSAAQGNAILMASPPQREIREG